jgi:hypothetical protein
METAASFEARFAPSSYPTHWRPRGEPELRVAGTQDPRPGGGSPPPSGARRRLRRNGEHKRRRDHVGSGSEQNKRPLMRKSEVVAPS